MFPTAIRVTDVDELLRGAHEAATEWGGFLRRYYRCSGGCEGELERYTRLLEGFRAAFGRREVGVVRAPGRVNIVGEHTDYNGGPVLPAAIDRDIAAVFAPRTDARVCVRDLRVELGAREFTIADSIPPYDAGDWGNYVKAAVQEIVRRRLCEGTPRGFDAVVHGTIPGAAGLSSSSAFVVLSAVMLLAANRVEFDRRRLAELATEAERYVGTRGGGMDQTASVRGEDGSALLIDFATNAVRPIAVPAGYSVLISHSMVNAPKSGAARDSYNLRAAESRIAGELFRRMIEAELARPVEEGRIGALRFHREELGAERFEALARRTFREAPYSLEEVASLLDLPPEEVRSRYHLPAGDGGYKLYQRFVHVIEESFRVERLAAALEGGRIREVGELMDESHRSCRDLYEISQPELDELVEIEREAGAIGARMTGAGFGGCTICLVEADRVEATVAGVIERYYRRTRGEHRDDYGDLIFPVRVVGGVSAL